MGTNYDRRLTKVALSLGLCPRHGEPLCCVRCDFTEDRLPAEQDAELTGYLERLSPVLPPVPRHGRCPWCGEGRMCLACTEASMPAFDWGPLTAAERDRCLELLAQAEFRRKGEP